MGLFFTFTGIELCFYGADENFGIKKTYPKTGLVEDIEKRGIF